MELIALPKLLADAGADVMAKNMFGQTALHVAVGLPDFYLEEDEEDFLRDSDQHVELVAWLVSKVGVMYIGENTCKGMILFHLVAGYPAVSSVLWPEHQSGLI